MTHLDDAKVSLTVARDRIREVLGEISSFKEREGSPNSDTLNTFLKQLDQKLFEEIDGELNKVENSLIGFDVENMGEEIQNRINVVHGLIDSARSVTSEDIESIDRRAQISIKRFSDSLDSLDIEPVDRDELTALIQAFQEDIAKQQSIGDKISRVVSTVTKIGQTAVKFLGPG